METVNRALWILVLAMMMAASSWFVSDEFAQEGFPPPDDLGQDPLTPSHVIEPKGGETSFSLPSPGPS